MSLYDSFRKRSEIPEEEVAAIQKRLSDELADIVTELRESRKKQPAYLLSRKLRDVGGRVEWLEADDIRKLLSFALKVHDLPTIRFLEAILEVRPDIADQIGMKAFMRESLQGPVEPGGFRWNGLEFSGLTSTQFRLLKYHWSKNQWVVRYFNDDAYAAEVFGDHAISVDRGRVDGHQTAINKAFRAAEMPFYMTVKSDHSFVRDIRSDYSERVNSRSPGTKQD